MSNPLLLKPAPFFITMDALKNSQVRPSGLGSVTTLRAIQAMIDKHSTWYVGGTRACDLPTCHRQILCRGPGKSHSPALGHWPGLGLTAALWIRATLRGDRHGFGEEEHMDPLSSYMEVADTGSKMLLPCSLAGRTPIRSLWCLHPAHRPKGD